MPALIVVILEALVQAFAPVVAQALSALITSLTVSGADDEPLHMLVRYTIEGIAVAHPDWSAAEKRQTAFDAIRLYGNQNGRELPDSIINALIEMHVQALKGAGK